MPEIVRSSISKGSSHTFSPFSFFIRSFLTRKRGLFLNHKYILAIADFLRIRSLQLFLWARSQHHVYLPGSKVHEIHHRPQHALHPGPFLALDRFRRITKYGFLCQAAIKDAWEKLGQHGLETEFEFLDRSVPVQTKKPKIQLPHK